MNFIQANTLLDEVTEFLTSCGGVYETANIRILQELVLYSIATNQYVVYRTPSGDIEHFVAYWKITKDSIEDVEQGILPAERVAGSVFYIVEHGNKAGTPSMVRMRRELRKRSKDMETVIYNHKGEGIRIFPIRKGVET